MLSVKLHLDRLGTRVEDKVTGFKGILASISFDLYGCVQGLVNPGADKDGKLQEQMWFDVARLACIDSVPVMDRPNFDFGPQAEGRQGAAEKPAPLKS
jgi:hypothetical protein